MKKILSIFLLTQILFAPNLYAVPNKAIDTSKFYKLPGISCPDLYMDKGNCKHDGSRTDTDNEYLYTTSSHSGEYYEADDENCDNNTKVCILGYSTVDTSTTINKCWIANVVWDGDLWKPSGTIPEYISSPWTPNSPSKKIVFINTSDQVIQDENGKFIMSLVGNNLEHDYHLKGLAYICEHTVKDASGTESTKYSYGCPDGSCPDIDTECPGTEPNPGDPGSGSGGSTPPPEESEVIHRNTVQPYLDALKIKCPSVGK